MKFTQNKLYQNGQLLDNTSDKWELNPKPALKKMCNERTSLDKNSGDATVNFVFNDLFFAFLLKKIL